MKKTLILIGTLSVLAFPAGVASASTTGQNIVQVAASNQQFSTLVSLVKKAGLVHALSGTTKLTVFAPTNAAFAKVPSATLAKLATHKALLVKVLEYHVLPGVVPASKVLKLGSAKTLEGGHVRFSVRAGHAYVNQARIIQTNIHATNGIIHAINAVLTPG
ncbi:MAG: fasciclin domain-containing protein [Solirubrobacterales bacterium]|nr:fasciclin domain-containing protein [Solirubrobacterales bacterium]